MSKPASPRRRAASRVEVARRIGADVAAPELWDITPDPEPDDDEITVEVAAGRLGVQPATVRGYLRGTAGRPARLERAGNGVSAASVEAYIARRENR